MNVGLEHFDTSLILVTCGSFFLFIICIIAKKNCQAFLTESTQVEIYNSCLFFSCLSIMLGC